MGRFAKLMEGLRHLRRRDWIALVLSFVLAAAVWTIHNLSLKYTVSLSVPVTAQCDGLDGYDSQSAESERVLARVRATGFDIIRDKWFSNTNPCRVRFLAEDLQQHPSGNFFILARDLSDYTHDIFGESAVMEYFDKDTVFFRFFRKDCKKVPVILESGVVLNSQYQLSEPVSLEPDSILVYADPLRLEHIDAVHTHLVVENNVSSALNGMVRLRPVSGVRFSQSHVRYSIRVRRCVERVFHLNITLENVPEGRNPTMSVHQAKMVANCVFPLVQGVEDELELYADALQAYGSRGATALIRLKNQPSWLLSYRIEPQVVTLSE